MLISVLLASALISGLCDDTAKDVLHLTDSIDKWERHYTATLPKYRLVGPLKHPLASSVFHDLAVLLPVEALVSMKEAGELNRSGYFTVPSEYLTQFSEISIQLLGLEKYLNSVFRSARGRLSGQYSNFYIHIDDVLEQLIEEKSR